MRETAKENGRQVVPAADLTQTGLITYDANDPDTSIQPARR
jgi:hypothetical protein